MIFCVKIECYFHKFKEVIKIYFFNSPQLCPFSFTPLRHYSALQYTTVHYSALYVCPVYKGLYWCPSVTAPKRRVGIARPQETRMSINCGVE